MKRKIIVREVGAFGLWEAVDHRWKRFIAGGFSPQEAEKKARMVLRQKDELRARRGGISRPLKVR